ncbi:MAG TPA: hypothetical protein VHF51_04190 [Solirubrobacteraceae bacterium]|nr:hypothetical protein [Solirubrobacteraceae bacterium]
MPDGVVFALPTLTSGDMNRDDQAALVVNQATAVIVAAFLEHASAKVAASGSTTAGTSHAELMSLINDVQDALRSF